MQKVHSFAHVIFFIVSNFLEYYILATAFKRFCSVIPYYQLFMSSHDSMLLPSRLCFCLHWYLPVSTITVLHKFLKVILEGGYILAMQIQELLLLYDGALLCILLMRSCRILRNFLMGTSHHQQIIQFWC